MGSAVQDKAAGGVQSPEIGGGDFGRGGRRTDLGGGRGSGQAQIALVVFERSGSSRVSVDDLLGALGFSARLYRMFRLFQYQSVTSKTFAQIGINSRNITSWMSNPLASEGFRKESLIAAAQWIGGLDVESVELGSPQEATPPPRRSVSFGTTLRNPAKTRSR
jgi:hypothetical protein